MPRPVLCWLALAGACARAEPPSFWTAMEIADAEAALLAAPDAGARRCAEALRTALTGGAAAAADELIAIGGSAVDAAQRDWARRLLLTSLRHEGQWPRLATLRQDHPELELGVNAVPAALRALPLATVTAPDAPAVLAWREHDSGLPIVAARLAGARAAGDVLAMLDTGAGMCVVAEAVAARLGARLVGDEPLPLFDSFGNTRPARAAVLAELHLGSLRATDVPVAVVDEDSLASIVTGVDAVIGWEVLRHAALELAPARREIVVGPTRGGADGTAANLVLLTETTLRLDSGGQPVLLLLDTGSTYTHVDPRLVARLGLASSPGGRNTVNGIAGRREVDVARVAKLPLRCGERKFELGDVEAFTIRGSRPGLPRIDGTLGMDVLAAFTVVIDGPARTVALHLR